MTASSYAGALEHCVPVQAEREAQGGIRGYVGDEDVFKILIPATGPSAAPDMSPPCP